MSFALLNDLTSLFKSGVGEIDLAAFSITGSDFNPTASATPNLGLLVPTDADLNPANAQDFTGSLLKIANGRNTETFDFIKSGRKIGAGLKGCVDFCNGVVGVSLIAELVGASWNERITSIKGCTGLKLEGSIEGNGSWCTHVLGRYYAEGRTLDSKIDYSYIARPGDTIVIARGYFDYLFGNKNQITLGAIKVAHCKSIMECAYANLKCLIVKAVAVQVTNTIIPAPATP